MYSLDRVYKMCAAAIFAAVIAVLSQVAIPLAGGVPATLQTFAVILAGVVLGAKWGAAASLIYLLLGCMGLPVFAGFKGGVGALMGLTGGFAMTFPVLAFISGAAAEWAGAISSRAAMPSGRNSDSAAGAVMEGKNTNALAARDADTNAGNFSLGETARLAFTITGAAIGVMVNYAFGCAWFAFVAGTGLKAAVSACVLPFVVNDVIKLVSACVIGIMLNKRLGMAGLKVSRG